MSGPLLYAMYSRLKLLSGSFGGLGGSFLSGSGFLGRSLSGSLGGFGLGLLGVLSSTLSLLSSLGFALGLLSGLELGSLRSLSGLLLGLSLGDHVGSRAELVGKTLDASTGVDELLGAGEERVALVADVDLQLALGGASGEDVAAGALDGALNVFGMNSLLHWYSPLTECLGFRPRQDTALE